MQEERKPQKTKAFYLKHHLSNFSASNLTLMSQNDLGKVSSNDFIFKLQAEKDILTALTRRLGSCLQNKLFKGFLISLLVPNHESIETYSDLIDFILKIAKAVALQIFPRFS